MSNNLIPTLLCVALGIAFGLAAQGSRDNES
jgi:hypothetical protein